MKLPFTKPAAAPLGQRHARLPDRPAMFSYHAHRSAETDAMGRRLFRDVITVEKASRTAKYWFQRFGVLAIILAACVSLANVLLLTPDAKVLPLDQSQTKFLHSTATYEAAADKLFSASILNRNKLTVDQEGIGTALRREFPELSAVSVKLPLIGHRPIIYITPEAPVLILVTSDSKQYIVGQNGEVLAANAGLGLDVPYVKDESGAPIHPGQPVLATTTISFIREVLYQLSHKQLIVSTFVLPSGTSELDAYLSGQSYFVKFNLASNTPLEQVGTFLAVQHNLAGQGLMPQQYIDVRVEGRAYYR